MEYFMLLVFNFEKNEKNMTQSKQPVCITLDILAILVIGNSYTSVSTLPVLFIQIDLIPLSHH